MSGGEAAPEIVFTSTLDPEHRDDLERLLFFNPEQRKLRRSIEKAVERFGAPSLVSDGGVLRIRFSGATDGQALFAVEETAAGPRLVGAMLYVRSDPRTVVLVHLAVDRDYTPSGAKGGELLALRLIARLRKIARQIHGVRTLVVFYGEGGARRIPIRGE